MVANVGFLPDSIMNSSELLPFMKLLGDDSPTHNYGWALYGWDGESTPIASLPIEYATISAYPNPFNPTTTLSFTLPSGGNVSLTVYDVSGREVITLLDGYKSTGSHAVTFDAKNLTSGVYFARLEAGEFRQTRKILLVK